MSIDGEEVMCHRGRLVLALFAGIVMVIGGCTAAQPTPAPATTVPQATEVIQDTQSPNVLAGTAWQLESMLGGEALVPLIQGTAPSLGFAIDRYTGYGGCDWF